MPDETLAGPPPDSPEDRAWIAEHRKPVLPEPVVESLFMPRGLPQSRYCGNEGLYDLEIQIARVRSLVDLEPNLDSYGADAPTQRAIDTACDFLTLVYARLGYRVENLSARGTELIVGPDVDGVEIIWAKDGAALHVRAQNSGKLTWVEITKAPVAVKAKGEVGDSVERWADEVLATFLALVTPLPEYGGEDCG
jgi:hypothetical protein